jgi:hypothetical protein
MFSNYNNNNTVWPERWCNLRTCAEYIVCHLSEKLINSLVSGVGLNSYKIITCESVKVLPWNIFRVKWKMPHWNSSFKVVGEAYNCSLYFCTW